MKREEELVSDRHYRRSTWQSLLPWSIQYDPSRTEGAEGPGRRGEDCVNAISIDGPDRRQGLGLWTCKIRAMK